MLERRDAPAGLNSVALPALYDLAPLAASGLTPAMVRSAYGFDNINFNGINGDGAGQTIAIVTAYDHPTVESDLEVFSQTFGLPSVPSFTTISQAGTRYNAGWAAETALDVQWAHAIAPGANILLVQARSAQLNHLLEAVNTARNHPDVSVVSMSWGTSEFAGQSYYDSVFTTPAGHRGVTFVAASGDSGGGQLAWPATSPNVVAVGGTQLNVDSRGNYLSETVWAGSTGGVSSIVSDSIGSLYTRSNSAGRAVPDVSYAADPGSGFLVFNSMPDARGESGWYRVGGTSAGAPQWAGLFAIVNQGRAQEGLDSVVNARMAIARASTGSFNDVTDGSNGFAAEKGFDLATGRGSPIANQLVEELVATDDSLVDKDFQGPLPQDEQSEPTEPPKPNPGKAIILAISDAQVMPMITQLIPPPEEKEAQDQSREYPEQVLPPPPPPIITDKIKPVGDADLSLPGGGNAGAAEELNPPAPSEPKPAEEKPEPQPSNTANPLSVPAATLQARGTTVLEVIDDAMAIQPEIAPEIQHSDAPAITAAAIVLLGGVACTDKPRRDDRDRKKKI